METYKMYCNNGILKILDSINQMWDYYFCCHGRYHALFVADTVEYILNALSYDARTVELGKIAGLLHDIGCIVGRHEHARMSAAIASVYLVDGLSPGEKNTIVQAISDHSTGEEIESAIGAALLIADKIDVSKKRGLPIAPGHVWYEEVMASPVIDDVVLHISGDKCMTIDYLTHDTLVIQPDKKPYNIILKAADYLDCTCRFYINGKEGATP